MTDSTTQIQLKKGALELCVLALLARRESYAYEIASTLATGVGMGEGTIYPLMRRMQDDGLVDTRLVESNSGPPSPHVPPWPLSCRTHTVTSPRQTALQRSAAWNAMW